MRAWWRGLLPPLLGCAKGEHVEQQRLGGMTHCRPSQLGSVPCWTVPPDCELEDKGATPDNGGHRWAAGAGRRGGSAWPEAPGRGGSPTVLVHTRTESRGAARCAVACRPACTCFGFFVFAPAGLIALGPSAVSARCHSPWAARRWPATVPPAPAVAYLTLHHRPSLPRRRHRVIPPHPSWHRPRRRRPAQPRPPRRRRPLPHHRRQRRAAAGRWY